MSESESTVMLFEGDDKEMAQAAAKARKTFRYFWRELAWDYRRIIPGLEMSAVKAAFSDPEEVRAENPGGLEVEHMWMVDVNFDGKEVTGQLINSPNSLRSVSEGDRVSVPGKRLTDWMYVQAGHVYGGFTVDLMRSRLGKSERKQHDDAWGMNFGKVGIVNLVPPQYIGGKAPKGGLLGKILGGSSKPQDYAEVAAAEHPMSVNMRESLESQLKEKPEMVHEPDDKGFTFIHQLALAGSLDGVDVCLTHGADPAKPAGNGMTPLALAKCLGWTRVMKRIQQALPKQA